MVLVTAIVQGKLVRFRFADVAACKAAIGRAFGEKRPLKKFGPDASGRVAYLLPSQLGALVIDRAPADVAEAFEPETETEPEEHETPAAAAAEADGADASELNPPPPAGKA